MNICTVFGTRPEAIKMAPVISKFRNKHKFIVTICVTSQHKSMLQQALSLFDLQPDYDLNIMKPNQNLAETTQAALGGLYELFSKIRPDRIVVQGDTTTTFAASLAAFYHKIPVDHVEAGIRSYQKYSPWPEEMNRIFTTRIADLHFAPTALTAENLVKEGIDKSKVFITGNTIIDVLLEARARITQKQVAEELKKKFSFINPNKKMILVTAHRRENFGLNFEQICKALASIANIQEAQLIFPVHLNPNVQSTVYSHLRHRKNIYLIEPVDYFSLVYLLEQCYLVLTDSGGIQEEAPTFEKPVLIMRKNTDRLEGVSAGVAKLIGVNTEGIVEATTELLEDEKSYKKMTGIPNPYGDGHAAEKISSLIEKYGSTAREC